MGQDKPYVWKSHKLGGTASQVITREGNGVSWVDGESDIVPARAYSLGGEKAPQRSDGFCQHFCLRECCPSS